MTLCQTPSIPFSIWVRIQCFGQGQVVVHLPSHNLLRIKSFSSISKMRTRSVANIVLSVMPLKSTRREGLIHISYMQYIYIWIYIFIWCAYMYIYYIYTYYKRRISPDGNFLYNMGLPKMFNASCEICTEENNHDHKVTINFWIWVLFFVGKKAQHNSNQLETLKGGAEYNRQLPFNQKAAC